jgi:SH3-like domain-containing protein
MHGQGKRARPVGLRRSLPAWAALAALGACASAWGAVDRPTPSGLPVPRYVSLKFDEVNGRAGPGDDYRLLWIYKVRGLPVQVVAETVEWRRICDPQGNAAWVHRRTTDGRRMVMNVAAAPVDLHRSPKARSSVRARLGGRTLASLDHCSKGWCKVRASGVSGWARATQLWGTAEAAQCR